MSWVKLDDKFWSNPDVLAVGNEAAGVFCRMLSYCADQRTFGDVPADIARFVGMASAIDLLCERGLLERRDEGYFVPDYCLWNPTREEAAALSKARSKAGKRGAKARWQADSKSHGKPDGKTHGKGTGTGNASSSTRVRTVGRARVTDEEHDLATAIVAAFNEAAGSSYTVDAHLTPVVGRIREHPELLAGDHERIIAANFAAPWWSDRPGVEVIYGNARAFERAMERGKARAPRRVMPHLVEAGEAVA